MFGFVFLRCQDWLDLNRMYWTGRDKAIHHAQNAMQLQRCCLEKGPIPMLNSVKNMSGMMVSAATCTTADWMFYAIQASPRTKTLAKVACL
jgi:hypothetical protein